MDGFTQLPSEIYEILHKTEKPKKEFSLDEKEYANASKFTEEHENCNSKSAMREKFDYHFIPGSIGTNAYIECLICGKKENITDYDCW